MRAAPELTPGALQLGLETPNTSAQAASNICPPQLGLGEWGAHSTDVLTQESSFRGRQQKEDPFARRHLSPTPQFSPSLPTPVWEATAQFLPAEPSSSTHLSLQRLQLPSQTPAPGYENHCPLTAQLWSRGKKSEA